MVGGGEGERAGRMRGGREGTDGVSGGLGVGRTKRGRVGRLVSV